MCRRSSMTFPYTYCTSTTYRSRPASISTSPPPARARMSINGADVGTGENFGDILGHPLQCGHLAPERSRGARKSCLKSGSSTSAAWSGPDGVRNDDRVEVESRGSARPRAVHRTGSGGSAGINRLPGWGRSGRILFFSGEDSRPLTCGHLSSGEGSREATSMKGKLADNRAGGTISQALSPLPRSPKRPPPLQPVASRQSCDDPSLDYRHRDEGVRALQPAAAVSISTAAWGRSKWLQEEVVGPWSNRLLTVGVGKALAGEPQRSEGMQSARTSRTGTYFANRCSVQCMPWTAMARFCGPATPSSRS